MSIHRLVTQLLSDSVLPYVIHVHGLDIPYQAELWIGGKPKHKHGVASLHIRENGYLTAEYVAYDADGMSDHMGISVLGKNDYKVVILDTQVEIPVYPISTSGTKARTLYTTTAVPNVVVYEGRVTGWLGSSEDEVESVTMLMTDFPNIRMPSRTNIVPDKPIDGILSLRGTETSNAVLTLDAGDWSVEFHQPGSDGDELADLLSVARVSKKDGTPFVLDDTENNILTALRMFLSFQSGSWINTALISGHYSDAPSRRAELAFLGRLSTPGYSGGSAWTASDYDKWPAMFSEFWKLFNSEPRGARLRNAIDHYVLSSAVLQNPQSATYGIVPARSTLEALVKWWNGKPYDFHFGGGDSDRFIDLLIEAIGRAKLGRDSGCRIDVDEVKAVIQRGTQLRNTIGHGSAGRIADKELTSVIAIQLYLQNLARLLISAKLGLRDRHPRGSFYSPKFIESK